MSCQNIESAITELARGQILEARVKEDTLAHMEACQRCAALFADQQTLSSGLRALRASVATSDMPARIEAGLVEAFRHGGSASHLASRPKAGPRWLTWSIAAAAAVIFISALTIPQFLSSGSREALVERASEKEPIRGTAPDEVDPISEPVDAGESDIAAHEPRTQRRLLTRKRPTMQVAALGNNSDAGSTADAANSRSEIATDFMPLSYGSNLAQMDDGQVVRVQLPRAALQSFGLPMNTERAGERVTDDVLLGHDGVARAIRFVR